MTPCVGAVVEGHGEVSALRVLIRRIAKEDGHYGVRTTQPHRLPRAEMTGSKVATEAWFLAAAESLRPHASICDDASFDGDPERPRDAKGRLEQIMTESSKETLSYKETLHQARFTGVMSLEAARDRSPCFAAFERDLLVALGDRDRSAERV